MNPFGLPWLELCLVVPLIGAAYVGFVDDALQRSRWCLGFAGATLACTLMTCAGYYAGHSPAIAAWWPWDWADRTILAVDTVSAPLLPLVALLHLLTALATARTKMGRFSFAGLLVGAAVRLAAFACVAPWPLIGLLALDAVLPYFEIRRRGRPARLYAIHAGLFVVLLGAGWACVDAAAEVGSVLMLAAVLVRTGAVPAHVWVTDLFEKLPFGSALLVVTPLAGVYAAVRLVLPVAPEWTLEAFGILALGTAAYAAGRGVVEHDARRFFAYLFVSHASLVLVGLGLHTPIAVTGALVMWMSSAVSLTGLGLTLRAIEARVGSLSLKDFRGLYSQSPALAICFLLTGLAAVGFPGTSGFVAAELLLDEAVGSHEAVGLVVVLTAAVNGIGVVRAYLMLFTGCRHVTGVALWITPRERVAVLTLVALILGGGLFPQTYLETRHSAARAVLRERHDKLKQVEDARNP
ncbi:MAG: oxidoreductase [Gemmataceae bacterium]|nr:oxidoreductase [Gemmataceae bacterium]